MQTPILGSAYVARSVNAANNRMVNLYPEVIAEGGQMPAFLNRAPGLRLRQAVGNGPLRGIWPQPGSETGFYVVSGSQVYLLASVAATPTLIGTIAAGVTPVSIADNGDQVVFVTNPQAYVYTQSTATFGQVTDPDFPGAGTVGYLDGYFVFNEPNSQRIWVTSLLDGTQIDPLDFASAEGAPDGVVGVIVDHREVWVFGTNSTEVWYNAGAPDFPLARIQGAYNEIGCVAPYSIAKMDNSVFWLGRDARGQGIVYRAGGYVGQRISTHAIEWEIQQYDDMSDAVAYTYQQDGHAFYVLNFPTGGTTWVFDAATGAWHERASFSDGEFNRHRGNCQCNVRGETLIGDYQNGNLYTFDLDTYADNGTPQKWLRSWRALPTGTNNLRRTAQHSLQLNVESGVGLNTGQGSDPQVMLRWSDDGGHTWSNEHWVSIGKIGEYGRRAIWRRLGMTLKLRDRVYEVSSTDPVKTAIIGAELLLSGTNG